MKHGNEPPQFPTAALEFGYTHFGRLLTPGDPMSWVNKPGISLKGKPSRIHRLVYIAENDIRVWGVGYPDAGIPCQGTRKEGQEWLLRRLHEKPRQPWLAFLADTQANLDPLALRLNRPGSSLVGYSSIKRGYVSVRLDVLDALVDSMALRERAAATTGDIYKNVVAPACNVMKKSMQALLGDLDEGEKKALRKLRAGIPGSAQAVRILRPHLNSLTYSAIARHIEFSLEPRHV